MSETQQSQTTSEGSPSDVTIAASMENDSVEKKDEPTSLDLLAGIHFDARRIVQNAFNEKLAAVLEHVTSSAVTWITLKCPFNDALAARCSRSTFSTFSDVKIVQSSVTGNEFEFVVRRHTEAEMLGSIISVCVKKDSIFSHLCKHFGSGGTAEVEELEITKWVEIDYKRYQEELRRKVSDDETEEPSGTLSTTDPKEESGDNNVIPDTFKLESEDRFKEILGQYLVAQRYHTSLAYKWNARNRPHFYNALPKLGDSILSWLGQTQGPATKLLAADDKNFEIYKTVLEIVPTTGEERVYVYKHNDSGVLERTGWDDENARTVRCITVQDVRYSTI